MIQARNRSYYFIFIVFTALVACAGRVPPPNLVRLQLNWSHQAAFAGYYVAEAQGFYAAQNLEVEILELNGETDFASRLAAGDFDFAIASPIELGQVQVTALDNPLTAVAATFQISPEILFALADSGIASVRDLPGRRVAIVNESWRQIIRSLLQNAGLDPASIIEVDVPFDNLELLYTGEVDVWAGYVGDEPVEAIISGHPVNIIYVADYNGLFYGDLLLTNQQLIDNNPNLVAAFVKAVGQGWQWIIGHEPETAQLVAQWQPAYSPAFHLEALYQLLPLVKPGQDPIGWLEQSKWEATLGQFYDPSRPGFTNQFIEQNTP